MINKISFLIRASSTHVLRFEDDTPAYLAIKFCIFTEENKALYKGRRGAPCMNLLNTFRKDLEKRKIINYLETLSDLENLRVLVLDKIYWSSLSFVNLLDTYGYMAPRI